MSDNDTKNAEPTAHAKPTKRFFVFMLTRDIELRDAVLDLLDNCIDGILRTAKPDTPADKPYEGYWAKITFGEDSFQIVDNCGGIPRDLAINSAFRMGHPDESLDRLPTVGMYGIGMKRAIFKMGRSSRVFSQTSDDAFEVTISPEWLSDDEDWELPLHTAQRELTDDGNAIAGTKIEVRNLYPEITARFRSGRDPFVDEFRRAVEQHYSLIIAKGFQVRINEVPVQPRPLELLQTESTKKTGIAPYIFKGIIDEVEVFIAVGFYRPTPDESEIEAELQTRRSRDDAGWTVVCNDRVVVYRDRSGLTGWGVSDVPRYHNQFIAIAGIVQLTSSNPWSLPLTTTKRGLDASSELYLTVRNKMMEGLKLFTQFTNKWKRDNAARKELFEKAATIPATAFKDKDISTGRWVEVRRDFKEGSKFVPSLPEPQVEATTRRITFSKPIEEIQTVSEYLFEDAEREPNDVGAMCFETILKKARE